MVYKSEMRDEELVDRLPSCLRVEVRRQASVGRINLPLIQAAPGQTSYAPQKIGIVVGLTMTPPLDGCVCVAFVVLAARMSQ
jgi:hypothetical protein